MNFGTKALTIFMCQMIVLEGCTSTYVTLSRGGGNLNIPSNEISIVVLTKDGSRLDLRPRTYTLVEQPSNFYYAAGEKAKRRDSTYYQFIGKFNPVGRFSADELFADGGRRPNSALDYVYFILADSTIVRARSFEYLKVDSSGGTGIWYIGDRKAESAGEMKAEVVALDEIEAIQMRGTEAGLMEWIVIGSIFVSAILIVKAHPPRVY